MIRRSVSHIAAAAALVLVLVVGSVTIGTAAVASAAVPPEDSGFVFVNAAGSVVAKGGAHNFGSRRASGVVGIAATGNGKGYWVATKTGTVYALGGARFGGKRHLSKIVGIAGRPGATGYWLVSSTGRVYAFGGAKNFGSIKPKKHVTNAIGIAPTRDGRGYWITTKTGQMFHYGDAKGVAGKKLKGIVAIAANASKGGFWLLRNNGQVYRFGSAAYYGQKIVKGSVGIASTPNGRGYWVITSNGAVSAHGNATAYGGRAGRGIVGIAAVASSAAHLAVATRSLPAGHAGDAYSATLTARGGIGPITWKRAAGALPPGVTLSATGALRGKPTKAGAFRAELMATDSSTPRERAAVILTFTITTPVLAIATTNLPTGFIDWPYSATLTATDNIGPVTWSVIGGSLPAGVKLASNGRITGTPTVAETAPITVRAFAAADGRSTTRALTLLVSSTVTDGSDNWAGYVVTGGPFTEASGTFNVPSLTTSTTAADDLAIWVGIDGVQNQDLIQAGVALDPNPSNPAHSFTVTPWWEILPAPSTPIDSLTVKSGDQVTVTVEQPASGRDWAMVITDDTTDESFTQREPYSGPANSAEWIVEAPTEVLSNGQQVQSSLAPFSPDVTFSNLALGETPGGEARLVMIQGPNAGTQVGTPSDIDANGFRVAFGATPPAAP